MRDHPRDLALLLIAHHRDLVRAQQRVGIRPPAQHAALLQQHRVDRAGHVRVLSRPGRDLDARQVGLGRADIEIEKVRVGVL